MDLYEGLKLKQIRPVPVDNTHIFDMVGMEFEVVELNPNTIRLQVHYVTIEVMDDLLEEYFQPLDGQGYKKIEMLFQKLFDADKSNYVAEKLIELYEEVNKKINMY